MTDDDQRRHFRRGLKPSIKHAVDMGAPTTLTEARRLAIVASTDYTELIKTRAPPHTPAPPPRDHTAMDIDAFQTPRLNRLSDGERDRLRQVGACFKCRQPGHISRFCPQGRAPQQQRFAPSRGYQVNNFEMLVPPVAQFPGYPAGLTPGYPAGLTPGFPAAQTMYYAQMPFMHPHGYHQPQQQQPPASSNSQGFHTSQ
ncbi:hypothetical protein LPJ66_012338 [Kickxella alabastrina]|uniref:Uncharacterized protein n=1 Tax=Kickxella alabastrina TaxID=61397 RepID=A0ACC1HYQ6_9FUNG|nr:hypothetical protein LPJ66_012338 [Kickxella alabastrina]